MSELDPAALENLRGAGGEGTKLLAELIAMFLEDSSSLLAQMRQGIEQRNAAMLHQAAHIMGSSSAMFGAKPLASLCRELETMGAAGSVDGGIAKMSQVEAEYAQVETALQAVRHAELNQDTDGSDGYE
jgi:HPt (histidine-containing phosphotransfer) domain-containing protein